MAIIVINIKDRIYSQIGRNIHFFPKAYSKETQQATFIIVNFNENI